MRSRTLTFALALSACGDVTSRPAPTAPRVLRSSDEIPALARARTFAPWSSPETLERPSPPVPQSIAAKQVQDLPWAPPADGVSCVVRGKTAPFPPPCDSVRVWVSTARGTPFAGFEARDLDVVWGIRAAGSAPWIHARSAGFTLTGFTQLEDVRFRLVEATPLVADHVWARPDAPVEIVGATPEGGLRIRIIDDVAGLKNLVTEIPCDGVAFDPPPPLPPGSAVTPPAAAADTPVVWPRQDRLTLRATPGGAAFATIASADGASVWQELQVLEKKAGATRVRFETRYARFDAWVHDSELSSEPIGGLGLGGFGCSGGSSRGRGFPRPPSRIVEAPSAVYVGLLPTEAVPAVRVAEGMSLELGEVRGEFVEVTEIDRFFPSGKNRFWIARSEVTVISK
jgi:hypothetical protein